MFKCWSAAMSAGILDLKYIWESVTFHVGKVTISLQSADILSLEIEEVAWVNILKAEYLTDQITDATGECCCVELHELRWISRIALSSWYTSCSPMVVRRLRLDHFKVVQISDGPAFQMAPPFQANVAIVTLFNNIQSNQNSHSYRPHICNSKLPDNSWQNSLNIFFT